MNKYTLLLAFITVFLAGIVSGILTPPDSFPKEMLSRVGMERVVRAQTEANADNRFGSEIRSAFDLFEFLVLLHRDENEEAIGVAGEMLNRSIPALERVESRGDRNQRVHARRVLSKIASEILPTGRNSSRRDAVRYIDQKSLDILTRYGNESVGAIE